MVEIAQFIKDYGWLAVTILIVMGGMARWYVFRWVYDEKSREVEFWKERALRSMERIDQNIDALQEALTLVKGRRS